MAITLRLEDPLVTRLEDEARNQGLSVKELALRLLDRALAREEFPMSPEQVVAQLRSMGPESLDTLDARGAEFDGLLEEMRSAPVDPDFDVSAWQQQWDRVRAELRRSDRMDDWAEGRG